MDKSITDQARALVTDTITIAKIAEQRTAMGTVFPLTLSPHQTQETLNFVDLQEYVQSHQNEIFAALKQHGALLFKGFDIRSAQEWASILYAANLQEMPYFGGAAVRKLIVGDEHSCENPQIVTTNESPPSEPIPFHNELAQTDSPPDIIAFYCHTQAQSGGASPLVRTDWLYEWLQENHPEQLDKFATEGVKYIRIVPEVNDPSSPLGRSWKAMFSAETRAEAQAKMDAKQWAYEWLDNGDCKTITNVLPAIRTGANGKPSFCNQVVAAYTGWIDSRNDPTKAVVFGDGSPMPATMMGALVEAMATEAVVYPWNEGDFVLIDNSITAHARQPFAGDRLVLAAITQGFKSRQTQTPGSHLVLSSGDRMPAIGFGLWKVDPQECPDVVYNAIKNGYRCFDEAADYGNERACGEGIARAISEGIVSREQLWITSKLWNTDHRPARVELACRRSMEDLGVDYLDLYLIHFPIALKPVPHEQRYPAGWFYDPGQPELGMIEDAVPLHQTWQAMVQLVEKGLVKNIGICNVGVAQLRDLTYLHESGQSNRCKLSVLQVELHPYLTQPHLLEFCREKGIALTGFSNLGAGSYVSLDMAKPEESCLTNATIRAIAQDVGTTPAQVVLRWAIQRGTAIIPKSMSQERQRQNRDLFSFRLSAKQMQQIDSLNQGRRYNNPNYFCREAFNTFFPIYDS